MFLIIILRGIALHKTLTHRGFLSHHGFFILYFIQVFYYCLMMDKPKPFIRFLYLVFVNSLFTILLAFPLLELYAKFRLPIPYISIHSFQQWVNTSFIPDQEIGYIPGPSWTHTGTNGFQNGHEYSKSPVNSHYNIVIIGDSITAGMHLMAELKRILPADKYRIWNAGIGGYNILQEAQYLARYTQIKPDLIIHCYCLNDFISSMTILKNEFQIPALSDLTISSNFLLKYSSLYRYLLARTQTSIHKLYTPAAVRQNYPLVQKGYALLQRYSHEKKSKLITIIYPMLENLTWAEASLSMIRKILDENKALYIDLSSDYKNYGLEKLRNSPSDTTHPNSIGHEIATNRLLQEFSSLFPQKNNADTSLP